MRPTKMPEIRVNSLTTNTLGQRNESHSGFVLSLPMEFTMETKEHRNKNIDLRWKVNDKLGLCVCEHNGNKITEANQISF